MRKTQYHAAALKAAEAVPVIAKKRAGIEGVEYDITARRMRMMIRFHRPRRGGQHGLPTARAGRLLRARNAF